jgi:predicted GNAT family acetyltransferase
MSDVVTDNPARSRYELALEGGIAFIDYQRIGGLFVLTHAEVPPALRGRGIGGRLTAGALELVRAQGGRVEARCPYVAQFIAGNAQYQDLLAQT